MCVPSFCACWITSNLGLNVFVVPRRHILEFRPLLVIWSFYFQNFRCLQIGSCLCGSPQRNKIVFVLDVSSTLTRKQPVLDCLWLETIKHSLAKNNFNTSKDSQPHMPQRRSMPPFLAQNWKAQTNRLSSQGLVAQPTHSFKNRTNHVSFPLCITLGIAYLMLYGSSRLPLPPPSLARSGQLRWGRRHRFV